MSNKFEYIDKKEKKKKKHITYFQEDMNTTVEDSY